jgi:hypothetical protein
MKKIDEITKKNPFKVPENYFDEVNGRILASTSGSEEKVLKISFYRKFRPFIIAAASIALFAVIGYTTAKLIIPGNKNESIPGISMEDIPVSYLEDIDIKSLENKTDPAALYDRMPSLSDNEIIDYLLLENVDINDIYETL